MKKALFFMIFIFATAICGYAQEAPAAEQNDDSELILRYQNRRTMRGYKMLFEAGYKWGLPDKEGFLCGVYDPDKWSIGASAGFQFNNFVFLGGGTDFQLYRSGGNTYLTVPVFGELRINVLNDKKFTPFGDVRFGYGIGDIRGAYVAFQVGVRFSLPKHHAIYLLCQYDNQLGDGSADHTDFVNDNLGFKLGYEF